MTKRHRYEHHPHNLDIFSAAREGVAIGMNLLILSTPSLTSLREAMGATKLLNSDFFSPKHPVIDDVHNKTPSMVCNFAVPIVASLEGF